mmetsp:Transcript_13392/g.37998  ORF Transcript_13392/g.37998 Transcript_13392/m.37998 type:complete len:220 (+) Transcript_13392:741-1400(+)
MLPGVICCHLRRAHVKLACWQYLFAGCNLCVIQAAAAFTASGAGLGRRLLRHWLQICLLCVLTVGALAQLTTRDPRLEALTVLLAAVRLLAVAALAVLAFPAPGGSSKLLREGLRIPLLDLLHGGLHQLCVLDCVLTVLARAAITDNTVFEAIAVQLEAPRVLAVAGFPVRVRAGVAAGERLFGTRLGSAGNFLRGVWANGRALAGKLNSSIHRLDERL